MTKQKALRLMARKLMVAKKKGYDWGCMLYRNENDDYDVITYYGDETQVDRIPDYGYREISALHCAHAGETIIDTIEMIRESAWSNYEVYI